MKSNNFRNEQDAKECSSRVRAGTRWRRLRIYYPSPGCRQGTILAPIAAWRRLPGSGGTWPLDILLCSAARWPPRTTSSRANGRTIRAHEQAAETAPPGHGPADHGALFDFDFGSLAAGQSVSFDIFYGAATSTVDAIDALSDVGAEVYSLGQWGAGGTDGAPITYAFGFKGVGGTPIPPSGVPEPASFGLIAIGSGLLALGRRLVRR